MAESTTESKTESKASEPKGAKTSKVVDFLGDAAPTETELGELRPEEGVEMSPEEAKADRQKKKAESIAATGGGYPDTPSGRALAEVGDMDGEDAPSSEEAREQGLDYARAKRKYRWGY